VFVRVHNSRPEMKTDRENPHGRVIFVTILLGPPVVNRWTAQPQGAGRRRRGVDLVPTSGCGTEPMPSAATAGNCGTGVPIIEGHFTRRFARSERQIAGGRIVGLSRRVPQVPKIISAVRENAAFFVFGTRTPGIRIESHNSQRPGCDSDASARTEPAAVILGPPFSPCPLR
jgi:hypothetical protein